MNKKNATTGKLIKAVYASYVYFHGGDVGKAVPVGV
jgi:hypothetical protein